MKFSSNNSSDDIFSKKFATEYINSISSDGMKNLNRWSTASSVILPLAGITELVKGNAEFLPILAVGAGIYLSGMILIGVSALERRRVSMNREFIQFEDENWKVVNLPYSEPHNALLLSDPRAKYEEAKDQRNKSAFPVHRVYRESYKLAIRHSAGLFFICSNFGEIESHRLLAQLTGLDDWIDRGGLEVDEAEAEDDFPENESYEESEGTWR